jgi:biotin-(acetyl-CoA carboxylase) ligase
MRILTDEPRGAEVFLSQLALEPWRKDVLIFSERELVRALGLDRVFSTRAQSTGQFWNTLTIVSEAPGSQFTALNQLLGAGHTLAGPTATLALSGRHFRGHREREWLGAPGNLHVSVSIPTHMRVKHAGAGLSMLPAVAASDAVSATTGGRVRPGIKWVNDVMIAEHKVGGVLTGARIAGHSLEDVTWGIGMNVAVLPSVHLTPFVPAVTCLHSVRGAEHVTLASLFWALLTAIETRFAELTRHGPSSLFTAYQADSLVLGRSVTVWDEADCGDADPELWGRPLADGLVTEIRDDLGIVLEGQRDVIHKGRLALRGSVASRPTAVRG